VKIRDINLSNNKISKVPSGASGFLYLNSLLLHSNPLRDLPVSLASILDSLNEISIDWFTYLQPFVGKIVRLKDELNDVGLQRLSPQKEGNKPIDFMGSLGKKKNNSFIPGLKKSKSNSKQARVIEKMKELFSETKGNSVTFSEFIYFSMRKNSQHPMD